MLPGVMLCLPGAGRAAANPEDMRILYLGDSLSLGAFGETLDWSLRREAAAVHTFVTGSGSPYYWLERFRPVTASIGYWEKTPQQERREELILQVPKIEALLRQVRPDVVVVQAGTTFCDPLRQGGSAFAGEIERVCDEFCRAVHRARAHLYWVQLPDAHPDRIPPATRGEVAGLIRRSVERYGGRVFDSEAVTEWSIPYPQQSDGIHYGPVESRQWAEAVAEDFQSFRKTLRERTLPADVPPLASSEEAPDGETAAGAAVPVRILEPTDSEEASDELQVKVILLNKSVVGESEAGDESSAFGVFEYRVETVYQGTYLHERVRVAHLLVLNGRKTAPNQFQPGKEYYLSLVRMEQYPTLSRIPLVSQLGEGGDLPVYICKF